MTAHYSSVNLHKSYFVHLTFFYHLYVIPDRKDTNMLFTFLTSISLQKTVLKSNKDKQNLRFSQQCWEGSRSLGMLQCAVGRGASGTEKECSVLRGKQNSLFFVCLFGLFGSVMTKALHSFDRSQTAHSTTQCHIPEDLNSK